MSTKGCVLINSNKLKIFRNNQHYLLLKIQSSQKIRMIASKNDTIFFVTVFLAAIASNFECHSKKQPRKLLKAVMFSLLCIVSDKSEYHLSKLKVVFSFHVHLSRSLCLYAMSS